MKKIIGTLVLSLPLGVVLLLGVTRLVEEPAVPAEVVAAEITQVLLAVPSMTCGSCEQKIRAALGSDSGVVGVDVDVPAKAVRITYDGSKVDPRALATSVTRAGYPARYLPPGTVARVPDGAQARSGCSCCNNKG